MMDRMLLKDFWNCGDNQIIDFAISRARLCRWERDVIYRLLDENMTQEQAAEDLDISTRRVQDWWYSASTKLLSIPWVTAIAKETRATKKDG